MTERAAKYWFDVLHAVKAIESFTAGMETLNAYLDDPKTKSAVERQLAIVGEALNQLRTHDPEGLPADAVRIVGMRNRLIHSYDNISDKIVWKAIREELPRLKEHAETRLPEL